MNALRGFGLFFLLALTQAAFVASLPAPLHFFPLTLAAAAFALQHRGQASAALWPIGYGLLTDALGIGVAPLETVSHALAIGVAALVARHLFSQRSLYGVAACAASGAFALELSRMGLLAVSGGDAARLGPALWAALFTTLFVAFCYAASATRR